ncbi:hypothetical protein D9758_008260 [Tetrapyrgos nigripes]|uniref:RNA helicase n=1 Tax=Tetrapyrgos nigripes TaxID=182062 RepID=A0A8H5LF95_9AGAR|nr:hypothetical protein D9758_008260 [Tetrapyrgos nigripes]
MPKKPCPTFLAKGSCSDANCAFEHTVRRCEVCELFFPDENEYRQHMKSKRHLKLSSGGVMATQFLLCNLCNKCISGANNWPTHLKTKKHISNASQQRVSPNVQPEIPSTVPGHKFCVVCRFQVANHVWSRHCATRRHISREKYATFRSVLEEAEEDKNGAAVVGDFDFKVIEQSGAANGVTVAGKIESTEPTCRFTLVDSTLASSKGRATYSPFSISFASSNRGIAYRLPLSFTVTMKTNYSGRFEDRLEMILEDSQMKTRFMISRSLRVIVGSQADHKALQPTSPYVPRKRVERKRETDVVAGEPAPALNAIPYKGRLTLAPIPKHLAETLETGTVKEVIDNMKKLYLPAVVNSQTYSKHFKHLLWAEEVQMERDLERYDIHDAKLARHPTRDVISNTPTNYYYLSVPGLAEKRPSVLIGDSIFIQNTSSPNKDRWFQGVVHVVRKEEVGLRLHRSFSASPDERFFVRFKLNRIPMRRQHQAMDYTVFSQDRVLFPARVHVPTAPVPSIAGGGGLRLKNALIGTNQPQLQAVVSIVRSPSGSVPFVIFGPPGTGKTVTLVESICQILAVNPSARILACAPSNSAADLIAERLGASKDRPSGLTKNQLFRAYAPSRSKDQVPDKLRDYTCQDRSGHFSVPVDSSVSPDPLATMKQFRVIVTTCVSASIVSGIGMPRGHFSHIFIDEAGQATEPEVMIAIKGMADGKTNVVLSGDPKQLGPIIRSGVARALGLERSFIERLMGPEGEQGVYEEDWGYGKSVVKLVKNFRSHPAILKFPNEQFYRGDLQACGDPKVINYYVGSSHLVDKNKKFPIVFHAISGKDDREASSPSFFNIDEVTVVKDIIRKLRDDRKFRTSDNDIGVIAPYHAQVLKLRTALRAIAELVKVGSVEEFQGQERRVIIISTVRSSREFVQYDLRHTLGFVANPRRFNVAVTRAQSLLFIVGDPSVLSLDPLWRSFLNYIHLNGGWTGPGPTWDTSEQVNEGGGYDSAVRESALEDMNEFTRMMENMTMDGVKEDADADEDVDGNVDRPWNEVE